MGVFVGFCEIGKTGPGAAIKSKNLLSQFLSDTLSKFIFKVKQWINVPYPAGNYMFKVNNRNTTTRCETSSKFTLKTPERHQNDTTLNRFYALF